MSPLRRAAPGTSRHVVIPRLDTYVPVRELQVRERDPHFQPWLAAVAVDLDSARVRRVHHSMVRTDRVSQSTMSARAPERSESCV
eukprot:scaffold4590_cov389-Prasinococcus_capsulatus_cf.AAC.5